MASPAVRALAKQLGINLDKVTSSTGDKLTKKDVQSYVKGSRVDTKEPINQPKLEPPTSTPNRFDQTASSQNVQTAVKMSLFEQGMVKSMTAALSVPHFNLHDEYDVTELETLRKSLKAHGSHVTLFALTVKAFSLAIAQVPRINASYDPISSLYECTLNSAHNISIAIDSPQGLAAPNLKNVEQMSAMEVHTAIRELQRLTAEGRLGANQLQGGTVALSNIGTLTGSFAAPLNLPGQVCIVALGRLRITPMYDTAGQLRPRQVLPVSFGCDHRVLDGATVARFSLAWKRLMENPGLILVALR